MTKSAVLRLIKSVQIANVKEHEKILDLGCGHKKLRIFLPYDIDYTGLDLMRGTDLEKGLPADIKNQTYDVIFMNEFIEHIENFKSLLIECRAILSEHGRIIISTPSAFRLLAGDFINAIGEDRTHIHCFKKSNMRNLARICSLRITKIIGTYIRFPPLTKHYIAIPTNQTIYSEGLIYRLEAIK